MDIITFNAFYLNPFLQHNNQPATNHYFSNNFSYNYTPKDPKTKNSKRLIHIIEPLAVEFMEYKNNQLKRKEEHGLAHSEDDFVFPSRINTALGNATFYKNYHKLLQKAGAENANFHTLRHTFATRCLECNINVLSISKTLGHSSIKVTGDIYIHMTASHQKECLDKLADNYYSLQPGEAGIYAGN